MSSDNRDQTDEVAALLAQGDVAAAERLRELSNSPHRPVAKEARRALFRLKQAGVEPPAAQPAAPARIEPGAVTAHRAYMTNVGGNGRRLLLFVRNDPHGGSPFLITALVGDEEGLVDIAGGKKPRREVEERIEQLRRRENHVTAEVPVDYARHVLQEAVRQSGELRRPLPQGYSRWTAYIGESETTYDSPLVFDYIDVEQLKNDLSISRKPEDLFQKKPFEGWILDPQEVEPWEVNFFETQQTRLALDQAQLAQRGDRVIDEATDALMAGGKVALWRGRLTETALVLALADRMEDAKQALYQTLSMQDDLIPHDVPFARALVHRAIFVVIALKAREEEEQEEQASSGLIERV